MLFRTAPIVMTSSGPMVPIPRRFAHARKVIAIARALIARGVRGDAITAWSNEDDEDQILITTEDAPDGQIMISITLYGDCTIDAGSRPGPDYQILPFVGFDADQASARSIARFVVQILARL